MVRSAIVATLVLALVLPVAPAQAGVFDFFSFERNLQGWDRDHFIDCEQGPNPCDFNWRIRRSREQAQHGTHSLKAFLDGTNDDGTIWLERQFDTGSGAPATVVVTFWLRSEFQADINTWPVVAYAGANNPETESDFTIVGQTEHRAGWSRYTLVQKVDPGPDGRVWAAFGFGATWESERTYFMDSVSVISIPIVLSN